MIVPLFDTVRKVDMREVVLDVPPQMVITKDNVGVEVDAVIYAQVTDPFARPTMKSPTTSWRRPSWRRRTSVT